MPWIVDNNFESVLASMKRQALDRLATDDIAVIRCFVDGHEVKAHAKWAVGRGGKITAKVTWQFDGRSQGYNYVLNRLKRG
jgi:hypothetical protein